MYNADIVEIICQRFSNAELSQNLTALKVQLRHQPCNYKEVLQDIASQVPSIGVDTFQKASEVSVQGTESGGAPDQGVYDINGLYTSMKDIPIVSAATGFTSANGRNYILVF